MRSHQKLSLVLCFLFVANSCNSASSENVKNISANEPRVTITKSPSNTPTQNTQNSKELQPEDVSIDVKIPNISEVKKKVLPPEVLENPDEKGGFLHPRCIAIDFEGDYGKGSSWFPAQIMVCPIDEYISTFAKSESLIQDFQDTTERIKTILITKPLRINPDFPSLVYFDASPAFTVNLNYVSFKNGDGFFVMTQYTMEPTIINNHELKYLYQGFTTDKKYYILGAFPIKSTHLPNDASDLKKAILFNKDGGLYDEYLINIKNRLKDKSSFTPTLDQIEETVKSLEIK